MKQKLEKNPKSTILLGDFNTPLSAMNRINRQKTSLKTWKIYMMLSTKFI
jgi:endonuclease/exonuclease/phosphatase (EEP) superfamily protein YafD